MRNFFLGVVLTINVGYCCNVLAADSSPCDMYFSGISFGSYKSDNSQPAHAYGKLGITCSDSSTHYICIAADYGLISSYTGTPPPACLPKVGTSDCNPANTIFYHLYQPDATGKITTTTWGADKTLPNQPGGMFCFTSSPGTCVPGQPCEFPVMATTDNPQPASAIGKVSGGYSYAASGAMPRFFLYYAGNNVTWPITSGSPVQNSMLINAYVNSGCAVTANPFHFGTISSSYLGQCVRRDDVIKVSCSTGTDYTVSLRPENAGKYSTFCGGTTDKCMINLASTPYPYLIYNLYKDSGCGTVWSYPDTDHYTGNASWVSAPSVYGKIISASTSPAATSGYYEDVIDVVVGYNSSVTSK